MWFLFCISQLYQTNFTFSIWFQSVFYLFFSLLSVSRLMGGSASGSMGHMSNMGSLAACSVSDTKPMQFPLAQRRKRRVLFTQAQVRTILFRLIHKIQSQEFVNEQWTFKIFNELRLKPKYTRHKFNWTEFIASMKVSEWNWIESGMRCLLKRN